jgi:hypothetical protein
VAGNLDLLATTLYRVTIQMQERSLVAYQVSRLQK